MWKSAQTRAPEEGTGVHVVISLRANRIKSDATLEELELVTQWLRPSVDAPPQSGTLAVGGHT